MSRLVAGAWLAAALACALLLGLGMVAGAPLPPWQIGLVVAASLVAGAPAAVLAAQAGPVAGAVLGPLSLALPAAATLGALGAHGAGMTDPLGLVAAGLAAAGLAALWIACGAGAVRLPWPMAIAAAAGTFLLPMLRPDPAMVLLAVGFGATVLGLGLLAPLALAPPRLRGGMRPFLLGLLLAVAVLAGPASGVAPLEQVLALVVALPGLGLLAGAPALAPFRLGLALLVMQAMVTGMALLMPGAAVALGLLPAEALGDFRWALLGAGFLPVFCALAAAMLPGVPGLLALGGFASLAWGLPLLLGAIGLLAAPILAILLATMLLVREGRRDAAGA